MLIPKTTTYSYFIKIIIQSTLNFQKLLLWLNHFVNLNTINNNNNILNNEFLERLN